MKLAELIALQRRSHGPKRLRESLGDGYLYLHNSAFRRIRDAAIARGYRFTSEDPGAYFGFPLAALDTLLQTRKIPYRKNFPALRELERTRPGFFSLADLHANRPTPNYVLHEAAHAVAFAELFGRPRDARAAMSDPSQLVQVMLGESFAMTAEYFAACMVSGRAHRWFFSINSYRHRTQKRKAVGELVDELGFRAVTWAVLLAFLYNNFLVDRLDRKSVARVLALASAGAKPAALRKLGTALAGLMVMSPEFRRDTARLFLTMHGYGRDVARVLSADPLDLLEREPAARAASARLVDVLVE
jgi:hypothetical protein